MAFINPIGGAAGARPGGRSANWGGKALLVFALALAMAIPGVLVLALVADREHRAQTVTDDISALQGGAQQLLGPMLVAPYVVPRPPGQSSGGDPANTGPVSGWYVVSPETGSANVSVHASTRRKEIFQVPVYEATATLHAHFAAPPQDLGLPPGAVVDWTQARIVVGFSDLRGARSDIVGVFTGAGGAHSQAIFAPSSEVNLGAPDNAHGFGLVAAPAAALVTGPGGGDVDVTLHLTGAQRLAVMPFAKSTQVRIAGDWPSPAFDGAFNADPPVLGASGFQANWSVPFIARGLSAHGAEGALGLDSLAAKDVGVTFVPTANPYANVDRALKYAVMFVGLVFLTFFVFEALSGRRLHPAQYLMIGLAQMVFYLLLLSVSEYAGFDWGFAAAAVPTVGLIGLYAGAAFRSRRFGLLALAVFGAVYGLIYLLLRLEDYALLAGSAASFVGLALAMYLTRHIDWYGGKAEPPKPDTPAAGASA
jgi:inner membrane protein